MGRQLFCWKKPYMQGRCISLPCRLIGRTLASEASQCWFESNWGSFHILIAQLEEQIRPKDKVVGSTPIGDASDY